ncbi:MAG: GNAT family N-acetyltransferase [Rhodoferax sp.]|nr:GNAT family N-acetyltransferase [Rhodoferax sp.]
MADSDYHIAVYDAPSDIAKSDWNGLLALQPDGNPFMRQEYLAAMHSSGSALPATGWTAKFVTLWQNQPDAIPGRPGRTLHAACAVYLKDHSYGEYVFDHAWANAYHQHRLAYYPKALIAPPFTPVPGARLLARDGAARVALLQALIGWCEQQDLSSLHILFASELDAAACAASGMLLRHSVQFHWTNRAPAMGGAYRDFDDFLASLAQDKRKKIRQERRKVAEAGVHFRWAQGDNISATDWDFFYRCYERTYYEHGNAPYLSRAFFRSMARDMPENWLLFVAERQGQPVACSLIALNDAASAPMTGKVAYGRYWGALERVDCLHFEACYYQPLQWCITHGYQRFEGGAQGEHKMARALLPVKTTSAHWLAHPAFADAIDKFLEREGKGIANYIDELEARNPFKTALSQRG